MRSTLAPSGSCVPATPCIDPETGEVADRVIEEFPEIPSAEKPTAPILACQDWPTNAELIRDVFDLYRVTPGAKILDPTHGKGVWWRKLPEFEGLHSVVKRDRKYPLCADWDYRTMEEFADGSFDVITADPDYVATGGRKTKGSYGSSLDDRFGLDLSAPTPAAMQTDLNDMLDACWRVLRRRQAGDPPYVGLCLFKCQDYVSSGRLYPGTHHTLTHALKLGFTLVDRFEMRAPASRPQPTGNPDGSVRRQKTARRNLSTLFVFRKGAWPS